MSSASQVLAEFAESLKFEDIPPTVIDQVRLHLLDALGIGLAASGLQYAVSILETIRSWGGHPESTVMRYGDKLPMHSVGLANASFVHGLDFDDTHAESITHVSACVVPAAMTVGEALKSNGRDVLTAMVLGYEVMARIGLTAPGGFHHHGFHPTPICGTFAAGVIAAKLMGLTAEKIKNALGICGSQASGIQAFLDDGSWTKRLHAGWAVHSGIIAAQMAEKKFFGPKSVLEGRYGLFATHLGKDNFDPSRLTKDLGKKWETLQISFKPYPVCHFSHACMNAARTLQQKYNLQTEDIDRIEALVPETIVPIVCEPLAEKQKPETTYGAQFSLPFCIGTILVKKQALLEDFEETELHNQEILHIAAKVNYRIEAWPHFPKYFSGGVRIRLKDGRIVEQRQEINYGHPENPLQFVDAKKKFFDNGSGVLPEHRLDEIIESISGIEDMPTIERLTALLVKPPL